ncbi:Cupredoxin [Coprinopsis marcescibilis]|uniref:Cupredoxin n=1 Tax=Coprinopsis marcescibilis TaxID=230819 RepID=A0A5C3K931_COPMA|nr:Cupredoxin [Coprinopsis marcescibilis]
MLRLASLLILPFVPLTWGAIGPIANLIIGNAALAPDGFSRIGVLAGPTQNSLAYPAPLIRGIKGNTFFLNVVDQLTDTTMLRSTSIHWHGFFQAGTAWADGPAGVTQCPISPGHSFLYKFRAKNQAGTFWYHSHHLSQYCDGLRGAMVVYDPFDPHRFRYDVDNENTVITLSDWYHVPAPSAGLVPPPRSQLINGKGRYPDGPVVPLSVINVRRGRRYRFRLVSLSCSPNYVFSIDGHTMVSKIRHEPD